MIDWKLIRLHMEGRGTPRDNAAVERWLAESAEHRKLYDDARAFYTRPEMDLPTVGKLAQERSKLERRFGRATGPLPRRKKYTWRIAAAILVPLAVAGGLLLLDRYADRSATISYSHIMPGSKQATLIIQETDTIELGREEMDLATPDSDGSLSIVRSTEMQTHRLLVPRGGEYMLQLEDGTRVWLNSASELTYTIGSKARERRVYLKGEAYFDVAPDRRRPFCVETDEVEVRAYGTQFNVNTRVKELIQTTLEEGSVSVASGGSPEKMLQPGELGQYDRRTGKIEIHRVDVDNYISWRSGIYNFEDKPVEEIMEELALWYDVEVEYAGSRAHTERFSGSLPRYREINDLLALIAKTSSVGFEIRGRTIIVK